MRPVQQATGLSLTMACALLARNIWLPALSSEMVAGFMAGQGTTAATSDTTIMPMLAVGTSSGTIFLISVASLQVLLVYDTNFYCVCRTTICDCGSGTLPPSTSLLAWCWT